MGAALGGVGAAWARAQEVPLVAEFGAPAEGALEVWICFPSMKLDDISVVAILCIYSTRRHKKNYVSFRPSFFFPT